MFSAVSILTIQLSLPASVRSRSMSILAIIYISVIVNTSHYCMD